VIRNAECATAVDGSVALRVRRGEAARGGWDSTFPTALDGAVPLENAISAGFDAARTVAAGLGRELADRVTASDRSCLAAALGGVKSGTGGNAGVGGFGSRLTPMVATSLGRGFISADSGTLPWNASHAPSVAWSSRAAAQLSGSELWGLLVNGELRRASCAAFA
jgi:hypothetical protein